MRIGVFDSGLGGLTVVRELRRLCPSVDILYLGDTARVPYGIRSDETIRRYAKECGDFLHRRGVDALVVACNTVSALALDTLRADFDMPVSGVIEPGAAAAVAAAQGRSIGVLGTLATIDSGAYGRAVRAISPETPLSGLAAPLLVPLVEEGWVEGEVPHQVIRKYLEPLLQQDIGALILGCTHYPLLKEVFQAELANLSSHPIAIVDSGVALARELQAMIEKKGAPKTTGELSIFVTDAPRRFQKLAERFLGEPIRSIEPVQLT